VGMPGAQLLGPALGNLHLFFHRLGPVLARRMLLTGDQVRAGDLPDGTFTDVCADDKVAKRTEKWAQKCARMPADGIAIGASSLSPPKRAPCPAASRMPTMRAIEFRSPRSR